MSDILYDAAFKYETMIGKGYHIVVGRKCKEYPIQLRFTQDAFFHLVGLQDELEQLLGIPIDLVTPLDLPSSYRDDVLRAAQPL